MKNLKKVLTILLVIFMITGIVAGCSRKDDSSTSNEGNTYYVATNGSDNNVGTKESPWGSIQHAADMLQAGDTVMVRGGVYYETINLTNSGQTDSPITFREYPGETAVIDGSNSSDSRVVDYGTGKNYIIWDGIDVRYGNKRGFWIEGDYNTVINCKVYGNGLHDGSQGVGSTGLQAIRVNYITVTNVEAYNNGWNGIAFEDSNYATIEYNHCHDNPYHNGIDLKSSPGGSQSMQTENNVRFNSSHDNNHGIYSRYQEYNEISNNLLYNNNDAGIYFHHESETSGSISVYDAYTKVYNNTIVGNGWGGIVNESANYLTIRNNIVYDNTTNMNIQRTGHAIEHNLETEPYFTDASVRDYTLTSSSPAIDAGIDLTSEGIISDYAGTCRPQASGFDIGAYESKTSYKPSNSEPQMVITTTSSPILQAEAGTITSPMQIVSDESASDGAYISSPTRDFGTVDYTVDLQVSGTFRIMAGVYATNNASDSFFVSIDGGEEFIWDLNPDGIGFGVWREDAVTNRGSGTSEEPQLDPYLIDLGIGIHNITFRCREKNTQLDYFYIEKIE